MALDLREQLQAILGNAYSIERELGGGGMSRVFVARETALEREVVVKVLPPDLAGELSSERFRREIQFAAKLQHPHIVPVLSAGTGAAGGGGSDDLLYYIMPLVAGETLRARLAREGELPVADVIRIARELSDALAYAHERGVVHRDLKPENVLLTRGHAVVADFGVAKAVSASIISGAEPRTFGLTSVGLAIGTPAYMAPEQAAADPATDHRADVYALGCVLYELLAGAPPFFGRPTQALLAAHAVEEPEPVLRRRPATPPALAALVMRMLEKRPADRPQTADEVFRSLDIVSTPTTVTGAQVVAGVQVNPSQQSVSAGSSGIAAVPSAGSRTAWRIGLFGGLIAGVVMVVAVVSAIGSRRGGEDDIANTNSVAIAPFENRGGSPELTEAATALASYLTDAVSGVDGVRIVPGSGHNARFTITGTLEPVGRDSAVVRARLVDQHTDGVLRVFTPARVSVAEPLAALDGLRSRVKGALALVVHPMLGPGALPRLDAPNAESFSEFAAGMEVVERGFVGLDSDLKRLDLHMQRAESLDSSFILPVIMGAIFRGWTLSSEIPAADATLDSLLLGSRGQLTPYEEVLVEWRRAETRSDLGGASRAAARLYAATPVHWTRHRYSQTLTDVGRYRAALPLLDSLTQTATADYPGLWSNYTNALHLTGDHRRELAAARKAKLLMPDRMGVRGFEIEALIALDSANAASSAIEAALSLPAERDATSISPVSMLTDAAAEFRVHGQPGLAAALGRRALDIVRTTDVRALSRVEKTGIANSLQRVGGDREAFAIGRDLVSTDTSSFPSLPALRIYGIAAARLGDTLIAERMMQRIDSLGRARQPFNSGGHYTALARIAAALGRDSEALRLSTLAIATNGRQFRGAAHFLPEFASLRRNPKFRQLIRPRDD